MTPQQIGALVDGGIPFAAGVYSCLLGYRVIGKAAGADPKWDAWHSRYGKLMRICGPIVLLVGLWTMLVPYTKVSATETPVGTFSTFPTRAGSTWEYQAPSGIVTIRIPAHEVINGVRCARREVVFNNTVKLTDHYRPELGILYKHAVNQQAYVPAFPVLKDLAAPTTWEYRSQNGMMVFQCEQTDGGSLKTPMGPFEKTTLVTMRGKDRNGETLFQSWYAPGVGLVREYTKSGSTEVLIEIKSYTP